MDSFAFERFQMVRITDRPRLEQLLLASEPTTCESNFLNIFVWSHIYNTRFQICGKRPYVYLEEEDELLFPGGAARTARRRRSWPGSPPKCALMERTESSIR